MNLPHRAALAGLGADRPIGMDLAEPNFAESGGGGFGGGTTQNLQGAATK